MDALFVSTTCGFCGQIKQWHAQHPHLHQQVHLWYLDRDVPAAARAEFDQRGFRGVPAAIINGQSYPGPQQILQALAAKYGR